MEPYLLGLYEKAMPGHLSWEEKLSHTKEAGFDFMEISIDESDEKLARLEVGTDEINAIKAAMKKSRTPIYTMCLSGHRKYPAGSHDPVIRSKSLEIMSNAVDLACQLGIRIIQLAGYDVYYEYSDAATLESFKDNLEKFVQMAAKKGVMLGFETMETPFMDTVEKAMAYVKQVNSPYLQVYPDIGNLTNAAKLYNHDLLKDIRLGEGHICAGHLKETKPGHYREIPFGTGHVDFPACMKQLFNQGVRLFVGEFWYTGSENWAQDLAQANHFLRQHWKESFS